MHTDDRVICKTPTIGRHPKRIARWKYRLVHDAILAVVPQDGDGVLFANLADAVSQRLDPEERTRLGSVGWYTTRVKLDMEVKGELQRVPGAKPQRLIRR